jgi:D-lactate dehydrogenase (cytochrome)
VAELKETCMPVETAEPGVAAQECTDMPSRLPEPLRASLAARFGARFSTGRSDRLTHGSDESPLRPMPPDAVVYARSTEEVARVAALCHEHRTPVIAFGVGSSVEGHVLALHGGVCLDLSQMDAVLAIRPDDLCATVQAGVTRNALNRALAHTGFFFSVDPGADASIGGMVATGASGTNTVRYGTMRENLVSLTVVTAEGRVIRTARRARKTSAGYNLTQLFAGSEGTLGIITEVTVRLHPQPEAVGAAVVRFEGVVAAVQAVIQALQAGLGLARAEMLDALTMRAINAHSGTSHAEAPTLFLEFCGGSGQVREQGQTMQEICAELGGSAFEWATLPEERSRLWGARHHAYFAALQLRPGCRAVSTDACVPLSALARCVEDTIADLQDSGLVAPVFGHVGDGNFHCVLLVDPQDPEELQRAEALSTRLVRRAIALDGTCTGEHGVGLRKQGYLEEELGPDTVDLMRRIKLALDPRGVLNPGKVFGG